MATDVEDRGRGPGCRGCGLSCRANTSGGAAGRRGEIWDRIVAKHDLRPYPVDALASWWHSDADLGRTVETFTDMSKSRRAGFFDYQKTSSSFLDLFDRLRAERIIPPHE